MLTLSLFFFGRNLIPVTQLYVSVDASTKDSLKKIDRLLFRDFWERLLDSLKALSEKVRRFLYPRSFILNVISYLGTENSVSVDFGESVEHRRN
jgi:wyosine [tRNA(Phe)-imidazoG37] synthetase (radical SAM superfamily)